MDEIQVGDYPVRRKLPVAYSTAIGRIITRFALMESLIRTLTYTVLGIGDVQGRVAIRQRRVADDLTTIQDLAKLAKIDLEVDWVDLKKAAKKVESYRDRLAHGVWLKHDATDLPVLQDFSAAYTRGATAPQKPKLTPLAVPIRIDQLRNISANIEQLIDIFNLLYHRAVRKTQKTSPDKHS